MRKKAIPLKETGRLMERGVATLTERDKVPRVFGAGVLAIMVQFVDVVDAEPRALATLSAAMAISLEDEFAQLSPLPGLASPPPFPLAIPSL